MLRKFSKLLMMVLPLGVRGLYLYMGRLVNGIRFKQAGPVFSFDINIHGRRRVNKFGQVVIVFNMRIQYGISYT